MDTEKVYISRDEDDDLIWVWRKPSKGNWSPHKLKGCDIVNYQREDMHNCSAYIAKEFKLKFGITIRRKTKKCVHLPIKLLNSSKFKAYEEL